MKKIIKSLSNWFIFWLWILICIFVSLNAYALITNVSNWDTLTATKWNELVNKVNQLSSWWWNIYVTDWQDIDLSLNQNFDWQWLNRYIFPNSLWSSNAFVQVQFQPEWTWNIYVVWSYDEYNYSWRKCSWQYTVFDESNVTVYVRKAWCWSYSILNQWPYNYTKWKIRVVISK